ncbi:hypothetical protein LSTR_LSTR013685 [Laodelphax striatellus]|uniref:Uncharacterized protein n=1 Tax=Laodelphax striatellus TaxID=195883 RepID=A0A482WJT9_LAOST|nr:hypothetical protein LSTR_LSTR013685 [Laodelphax striatellus]
METDVEDFLMEDEFDKDQFSLEEMENALQNNDSIQLSSGDSQKSVLKELNRSPVKRGKRLAASKPVTYRQISSPECSEVNISSSNSSDNTTKQSAPKKKRIQRLKKPVAKKKKYMDKENISENILETNNRPALLDRTNSSERSTKFPKDANSDKVVSYAKDGKDPIANEKVLTESSAPVKEAKTEKPIPVYKKALDNVRLTPPPVDNKLDLYEFEIDENEQPVKKKKKRQPRVMKSRKKIATKPVKNVLQNIVVPERTIGLRCDNTVKNKTLKSKTGVVRFDIVKSIEKHTDALERNKKILSENTPINPRSIAKCADPQKKATIQTTPVRKSLSSVGSATTTNNLINRKSIEPKTPNNPVANQSESDSNFDFLIYVNKDRKENLPYVTVFKNVKDNSFEEGACCGWDANLQPVLVLDDTMRRTKALNGSVQNGKQCYAEVLKKLRESSFEGACSGWDENLQPVIVPDVSTCSSKNSSKLPPTSKPSALGRDVNNSKVMDRSTNDASRFDTSDASIIFESAVLGRDHNDTDYAFVNSFVSHECTVDERKDDSKSFPENISLQKVTLRNRKANQSGVQIREKVMSKNQLANQSVVNRQNERTVHHPIPLIRSVNPVANKAVANASKIDFDNNFGFDDDSEDVIEDKTSSSNANNSVPRVGSTNQTANRTGQELSVRNESKIGDDNNFGFDCDSSNSVDVNRDNSKTPNTSAASTSNTSISSVSTSSRLRAENTKKPEAQVSDVIRRLKGQLNITAVSTPVSTKQTKLNFNFKNKSTVSNDSAADTSLCSPIAQQSSSNDGALTPTFLKPPRKSYTHTPKAKKAVRFGTSFAFDQKELKDDDDDDDDAAEDLFEDTFKEKIKAKKVNQTYKKAGKAVKKEEKEIERLVSAINSQFQKVEEFELCVEK